MTNANELGRNYLSERSINPDSLMGEQLLEAFVAGTEDPTGKRCASYCRHFSYFAGQRCIQAHNLSNELDVNWEDARMASAHVSDAYAPAGPSRPSGSDRIGRAQCPANSHTSWSCHDANGTRTGRHTFEDIWGARLAILDAYRKTRPERHQRIDAAAVSADVRARIILDWLGRVKADQVRALQAREGKTPGLGIANLSGNIATLDAVMQMVEDERDSLEPEPAPLTERDRAAMIGQREPDLDS